MDSCGWACSLQLQTAAMNSFRATPLADDRATQIEELEVLQSIYGEQCIVGPMGDSCEVGAAFA